MGVPVGTKLGRYEVVKHLARGGMADLSVARATGIEGFERHVVIKHLRPEQSEDAAFVQMFVTEARLAGALHHHNIVQVHDIGQAEGRHFFAMEYVHGEDLRHMLSKLCERREHPPLGHVVTIATAVAAALHHAHEQKGADRKPLGIVHRDVTPANIIVGYDGNVKVVDFGIAKAALRTSDTAVGMLKGKVPYMAPEQCTGKPIDRRSDIFALGIVLYELATVRRLFKGGNEFFTMTAVVHGEIPKPTVHRKDLPAGLEDIIMKALSRKPSERYQTADEMRIALDQFADKANLRTSTSALADYMKKLFGEKPEPWMVETDPKIDMPVDFDKTEVGLVAIPDGVVENSAIPKSVATTRGSLIEQARLNAISNKLEPTPKPNDRPIPSVVPKSKLPMPLAQKAALANADTDLVQIPTLKQLPDEVKTAPAGRLIPTLKPLHDEDVKTTPANDRATSNDDTNPGANKDPEVWMRVPRDPVLGKPPIVSGKTTERASTDVDEKTDVSTPPPPPEHRQSKVIIAATGPDREPTEVVTPLPSEMVGDNTDMTRMKVDRRWLLAGGIAVSALVIAVVIMVTGRTPDEPTQDEHLALATKDPQPPPPTPLPEPKPEDPPAADTAGTTKYKPLDEKAIDPKDEKVVDPKDEKVIDPKDEKAVDETKVVIEDSAIPPDPLPPDPKTTPTKQVAAKATPAKTTPRRAKTVPTITKATPKTTPKVTPKTTPKTTPTNQTWDPDALFLKPKTK
ncbi:MAG: serine/threonine protein kinase [Deltaproteobacteria bacterium]|nr:serine/threonine protein kinase [Deltaproteobacteria bacterium]